MRNLRIGTGLMVLCALGTAPLAAEPCTAPATWTVRYSLHENPADPNSPIAFRVELALRSAAYNCDAVGWRIERIEIHQLSSSRTPQPAWHERNPHVDTADGLWWVAHADVSAPAAAEFVRPPLISGTATAIEPDDPDLEFELAGEVYQTPPPPQSPPYAVTAALDYRFVLEGNPEPLDEGDDDPGEVTTEPCQ